MVILYKLCFHTVILVLLGVTSMKISLRAIEPKSLFAITVHTPVSLSATFVILKEPSNNCSIDLPLSSSEFSTSTDSPSNSQEIWDGGFELTLIRRTASFSTSMVMF